MNLRSSATALALACLAACSSNAADEPTTTTSVPLTVSTTPRPNDEQALYLWSDIGNVYESSLDQDQVVDRVVNICQEMLAGKTQEQLVANTIERFAGGTRPDPTPEQAAAIVEAVRSSGFCA